MTYLKGVSANVLLGCLGAFIAVQPVGAQQTVDQYLRITNGSQTSGYVGTGNQLIGGGQPEDLVLRAGRNLKIVVNDGNDLQNPVALEVDHQSGKVGIGTQIPKGRLHISSGITNGTPHSDADDLVIESNSHSGISLLSGTNNQAGIFFGDSSSSLKGQFYYHTGLGKFILTNQGTSSLVVDHQGNIGVGTNSPQAKLDVDGNIMATGFINASEINVKVDPRQHPDFVFEKDYNLMSLDELEKSVAKNKHLPGIPSAKEAGEKGLNVGEMQTKLLQKIEELTLYVIGQEKRMNGLSSENALLKERLASIEKGM